MKVSLLVIYGKPECDITNIRNRASMKIEKSLIVNQDTSYRVQIISIILNFERTFILEQFVYAV